MTLSIDADTQPDTPMPPRPEPVPIGHGPLVIGVRIFTAMATATAIALGFVDLASDGSVHLVVPAMTCVVLAGIGGAILVIDALLGSRRQWYLHGELNGWMRSWHGQPPEADDPLL